jgi:DNA polymerase delta subunit 4
MSSDISKVFQQKKSNVAASKNATTSRVIQPPAVEVDINERISKRDAEQVLKQFDFDLRYGPLSGSDRLQRYQRALSLGLNPPPQVGEALKYYPELTRHVMSEFC